MTVDLLAMRDWLRAEQVTVVDTEATGDWRPPAGGPFNGWPSCR